MKAWIKRIRNEWFPEDPISLSQVFRATFLADNSKIVMRLIIAIFISAFLLVLVKNAYHQAFMRLQELKAEHDALHTEWMQLMIEEGTWGNYDRVHQIATQNLNMTVPTAFNTKILVITTLDNKKIRALAQKSMLGQVSFQEGYLPSPRTGS